MEDKSVSLADAKAHLSELTERAARGESVVVTKHGRPVVRFVAVETPRTPIDCARLRALTDSMPKTKEDAGRFIRRAREGERY